MMRALLLLAAMLPSTLFATTYSYTSGNYVEFLGAPIYNSTMRITGSVTTNAPLPGNLSTADIGPTGSNLLVAWSFNDGINTYTNADSALGFGPVTATTDSSGNITDFQIAVFTPKVAVIDEAMSGVSIYGLPTAYSNVFCAVVANNACDSLNGGGDTAAIAEGSFGRFTTLAAPTTPAPAGTPFTWISICLAIILAAGLRKSKKDGKTA